MTTEDAIGLENEKLIGINAELEKKLNEVENEMIRKDEKLREYIKYNKLIDDFNQVNNGKDSLKDSQLYVITLKGVLKFVEFIQRLQGYLREFAEGKAEINGKKLFELLEKEGTFEHNLSNALEQFEETIGNQMMRVREEWAEWRRRVRELENLVEKTSDSLIEKELRVQVDSLEKELINMKWAQVEWKGVNASLKYLSQNRQDIVNQYFIQINMQNRLMRQMYELVRQMKNDLFQVRQANLNLKQDNVNLAETLALLLKKQTTLFNQWQESQKQREQLESVSDNQLKLTQDVLYQKVQQLLQELDSQKSILAQEYELKLRDGLQFLMAKNGNLEKLLDGAEQDMLKLQSEKSGLEEICYDLKNSIKQLELDKQFLNEQVNSLLESKQLLLEEHENQVEELKNDIQSEAEKFVNLSNQFRGIDIDNLNYTLKKIQNQRESLKIIVKKLEIAQGSMKANLSCLLCLKQMIEPRTLAPCGHTFCQSCVEKFKSTKTCPECDGEPFSYVFRNRQMNEVLCKMVYIQQMIEALDVPDFKFQPIEQIQQGDQQQLNN
eukprot:TRINITY_DN8079_c0_g1_i1.p1 TRINITY_DN8079_c0_g1~~TRINITY_DN8079_c0_g1_i1.p1  ORF type:complete len:552 (-),score=71.09 TRINITY_DN8079_c0_g1_i1:16-1671(-)